MEEEKLGPGINADNPGSLFSPLFIVVEHFYAQAPFYAPSVSAAQLDASQRSGSEERRSGSGAGSGPAERVQVSFRLPAMCRRLLSCPPLQRAASSSSVRRALRLLLPSSFITLLLPPSLLCSLRSCALLCYFKRSGASWVLQCLLRACLVTYGGDGSRQRTTIPRVPLGAHIKVSDYTTLEGGWSGKRRRREEGTRTCFNFWFCSHQDLKEKKLVEEKENGKDAATNGKVTLSFERKLYLLCSGAAGFHLVLPWCH